MTVQELEKKLLAAARALPPSLEVPYAFEKRIMANLAAQPLGDIWALWSHLLWRAAAPCVAVTLILGVWTAMSSAGHISPSTTLATDLERTVWGPLLSLNETW